jgi:hypothetical protein
MLEYVYTLEQLNTETIECVNYFLRLNAVLQFPIAKNWHIKKSIQITITDIPSLAHTHTKERVLFSFYE